MSDQEPYCDHCGDHGCRACDPDATATPVAWVEARCL